MALFAEDEALGLREGEIGGTFGVLFDAGFVAFVGTEAVEGDESPGDVVCALVRKKIANQMASAARNDAAPVFGVLLECVALEWINLIANHAHHFEFHRFPPFFLDRAAELRLGSQPPLPTRRN